MATGLNKVLVIGSLGKEPELKYTPSGQAVATFSVAANESYTDKEGNKVEKCEWFRIVAWGKLAELCGQYLNKGRQVYVEGKLQTRKYNDKDGAEKTIVEVVAREVQFLGSKQDGSGQSHDRQPQQSQQNQSAARQQPQKQHQYEDMGYGRDAGTDDIPF